MRLLPSNIAISGYGGWAWGEQGRRGLRLSGGLWGLGLEFRLCEVHTSSLRLHCSSVALHRSSPSDHRPSPSPFSTSHFANGESPLRLSSLSWFRESLPGSSLTWAWRRLFSLHSVTQPLRSEKFVFITYWGRALAGMRRLFYCTMDRSWGLVLVVSGACVRHNMFLCDVSPVWTNPI
ncbi:uncharacterized protein LOC131155894 [Malania oleifera]|uniref:uncharacterized protein LOC131155894 n=1 Tax=Malania oleifera TaxID=397392 RepID=UPI0025AE361B|nr:uncharacterized protein LOC131155894 [Malania oleifera]